MKDHFALSKDMMYSSPFLTSLRFWPNGTFSRENDFKKSNPCFTEEQYAHHTTTTKPIVTKPRNRWTVPWAKTKNGVPQMKPTTKKMNCWRWCCHIKNYYFFGRWWQDSTSNHNPYRCYNPLTWVSLGDWHLFICQLRRQFMIFSAGSGVRDFPLSAEMKIIHTKYCM